MAEYDTTGACAREYVYLGDRLAAEYLPQTGQKYYYTSDPIRSSRLVTDTAGTVVYSAMHDPYGGIQKVWVNTYDPRAKFSGKEREKSGELDYFGARYYDHLRYRFLSVDPVRNKDKAIADPQSWNLYSYCSNNPITLFDPDGMDTYVVVFGEPGKRPHNLGKLVHFGISKNKK